MNPRDRLEAMIPTTSGSRTVWNPDDVHDALDALRIQDLNEGINALNEWAANISDQYEPGLNFAIGVLTAVRDHRTPTARTETATQ